MDKWVKYSSLLVVLFLIFIGVFGFIFPSAGLDYDYGLTYDSIFFIFIIALVYSNYGRLNQDFMSYSLILFLMVFHIIGVMFLYGTSIGFVEFDMIMHFLGGFALAFFFMRFLHVRTFKFVFIAFICVLGLSVIHELIEFFGYYFLEGGSGIFMHGYGDEGAYNDVMIDLLMNTIGAIAGVFIRK